MRTTIEVFTIQIKSKNSIYNFSNEPDLFNLFSDNETGFVKFIDLHKTGDVPSLNRTVRIPSSVMNDEGEILKYHHNNMKERYICGIIETGLYGQRLEIADKNSPHDVAYTIESDQAIIKPFFYYLKIPRTGDKALLILERVGNEGIYPLMYLLLKNFLNERLGIEKNFNIVKGNFVLNNYVENLRQGRYKSITLMSSMRPKDAADRYFGTLEHTDFTMELKIKIKSGIGEDKERNLRDFVNSGQAMFEIPELNNIFEGADKKVVSSIGAGSSAKDRTYYINDEQTDLIRPYYDIEVEPNDDNFSDYRSIKQVVKDFIAGNTEFNLLD